MVNHGTVSRTFDRLAKQQCQRRALLYRDIVHPALIPCYPLHIEYHRTFNPVRRDFLQYEGGLLQNLLLIDSLTVKIHSNLDSGGNGPFDIVLKILILHHLAAAVSSVSHPDKGEFHPILSHQIPVDLPLVLGHVDPFMGNHLPVLQILVLTGFQYIHIGRVILMQFQIPVNGDEIVLAPAVND